MSGKNGQQSNDAVKAAIDAVSKSEFVYGLTAAKAIIGKSRQQIRNLIANGNLKDYGTGGFYSKRIFLRSDCERLANPENRTKAGRKFGYRKFKI